MPRYVTRAADIGFDRYGGETHTASEVIVEESGPRETGLFDAMGNKIYRVSDKTPVGFTAKARR